MVRRYGYNVHDLLRFEIVTDNKMDFLPDVNFMFSYFRDDSIDDPDISLRIGDFTPSMAADYQIDHKYRLRKGYFFCKDSYGRARWKSEIIGLDEDRTIVNFSSRVFGIEQVAIPDYLAQNMILRPLIELRLLQNGYVVVHCLAIDVNGKAKLLCARGGAHKTRMAMHFMKSPRFRLISDDRAIVGKNGEVLSFPLFKRLVDFRSETLTEENIETLTDRFKLLRYLKSKNDSRGYPLIDRSNLDSIYIMIRREGSQSLHIFDLDIDSAISMLTRSSKAEMMSSGIQSLQYVPFYKYMLAYSFAFPESGVARHWDDYSTLIEQIIDDIPVRRIELQEQYSDNLIRDLEKLMG